MTTQIRRLMFVAAVAILPVACGTSSPMGTDLAALEARTQVTSFRSDPTVAVPPGDTTATPPAPTPSGDAPPDCSVTDCTPTPTPVPSPGDATTTPPSPGDTTATPPAPTPSGDAPPDCGVIGCTPSPTPVPSPGDATTTPPSPGDATTTPVPSPAPPTSVPTPVPVKCEAASIEIVAQRNTFREPSGEGFMAILSDKGGSLIEDGSCESLVWAVEGAANDPRRVVIHYESDSRHVYVEGMHGTYTIRVTAPNGVTASIGIEVQ